MFSIAMVKGLMFPCSCTINSCTNLFSFFSNVVVHFQIPFLIF